MHGAVEAAQAHDSLPEKVRGGHRASVFFHVGNAFVKSLSQNHMSECVHVVGLGQCHSHPGRVKGGR